MGINNTIYEYGSVTKWLHWLVALGVISLLTLGFLLDKIKNPTLSSLLYDLHKSTGLLILLLMLIRLIWRLVNPIPALPYDLSSWQKRLARLSHFLLYSVLILMPLSGWIMSVQSGYAPVFFGLFTVNLPLSHNEIYATKLAKIHGFLSCIILFLVSIHIMAAFKHWIVQKDNIMQRMFPKRKQPLLFKKQRRSSSLKFD